MGCILTVEAPGREEPEEIFLPVLTAFDDGSAPPMEGDGLMVHVRNTVCTVLCEVATSGQPNREWAKLLNSGTAVEYYMKISPKLFFHIDRLLFHCIKS
jgi:hypothetical protein